MAKLVKKKKSEQKDPKKESILKDLAQLLKAAGFEVRREELKRGPGWAASSGSCRAQNQKLILIDRKLPQDDQINFLISKIVDCKVPVVEQQVPISLPAHILEQISLLSSPTTGVV